VLGGAHSSFLYFTCRIGHSYSAVELLDAKEQRLEARLWKAVHGLEELATVLPELADTPFAAALDETQAWPLRERAERAAATARELRAILEVERPLQITLRSGASDERLEDGRL
jgi:hypothetical protein